jgi:hypothetical protein
MMLSFFALNACRRRQGRARWTQPADGTTQFIIDRGIQLVNGAVVRLSDGEVTAAGVLEYRDDIWVATALKWEPH